MSFKFEYKSVPRTPNIMVNLNPLKRGTGKTVTLEDRINTLNKSSVWQKTISEWRKKGKKVDASRLPKVSMEKLGVLLIDEDIQRMLDEKHCANKIGNPDYFDPAMLRTAQCIKTSDGKFISIDSQHTCAVIASLIAAGFLDSVDNWRDFKFPFQYIETDSRAFARKAFGWLNGKGVKKQSQYQQLRNAVFAIRIDKDLSDSDDVELERRVSICESHNCFPVEENSRYSKMPGTFTNIITFKTLNDRELELACEWHNKYFHYESVHVSLFFIFRDLIRSSESANIPITSKLLKELAALIQDRFGNLYQYQESVTEAYRKHNERSFGFSVAWKDDAYAVGLMQLYKHFGGKEKVPTNLIKGYDGLFELFDNDLLTVEEEAA